MEYENGALSCEPGPSNSIEIETHDESLPVGRKKRCSTLISEVFEDYVFVFCCKFVKAYEALPLFHRDAILTPGSNIWIFDIYPWFLKVFLRIFLRLCPRFLKMCYSGIDRILRFGSGFEGNHGFGFEVKLLESESKVRLGKMTIILTKNI